MIGCFKCFYENDRQRTAFLNEIAIMEKQEVLEKLDETELFTENDYTLITKITICSADSGIKFVTERKATVSIQNSST
jgi:hypothetical protein